MVIVEDAGLKIAGSLWTQKVPKKDSNKIFVVGN